MKRGLIAISYCLFSTLGHATEYQPDVDNGAFLHAEHCSDCHSVPNHEALYTRANRVVQERIRLNGQVSACVQVFSLGWFPEEEQDVSAYLNETYYHFPPQ
ncbi:MAG: hypothetical protein EBS77_06035 [Gammaproteobacteria bacterium]|nr:hypothetical protein [Gammaproteobacteria bacterium]